MMEEGARGNRTGLAAGIIGTVLVLLGLAILLDLGPFAEDELSVPEFLARGDEICEQAHDEFREIQASSPRTAADAEAQVEALIEVAEEERDAILDLGAPPGLADDLDDYIADREQGIETLEDGLDAARADDPDAYENAQAKLASRQEARRRAARRLGFEECSEPLVDDAELERQAQPPADG